MNVKEIRVGNTIQYYYPHDAEWGDLVLSAEDIEDIEPDDKDDEGMQHFKPIPLTKERLLLIGFRGDIDVDSEDCFMKGEMTLYDYQFTDPEDPSSGIHFREGDFEIHVKTLHQLENLWHALYQTEIKETK